VRLIKVLTLSQVAGASLDSTIFSVPEGLKLSYDKAIIVVWDDGLELGRPFPSRGGEGQRRCRNERVRSLLDLAASFHEILDPFLDRTRLGAERVTVQQ
jgi:hypothetical protein